MKASELAQKYGVTAMQVGRRRKQFFPDGKGPLNDEEVEVLSSYYESLDDYAERKDMEEAVKPKFVDGMITFVKEGQRRCEVHLIDSRERVIALMPFAMKKEMVLRPVKLEEIEYEEEKFYRDASLAGRAWKS